MRLIVNIDVPDLEPAIAFYREALGLTLQRTIDNDVAALAGAGSAIYLLARAPGTEINSAGSDRRDYDRHWAPVHMDFVVNDVASAADLATAAGARRESDCVEWRGSRCISFSDPFGHGFCLIEFCGNTYESE